MPSPNADESGEVKAAIWPNANGESGLLRRSPIESDLSVVLNYNVWLRRVSWQQLCESKRVVQGRWINHSRRIAGR